MALHLTPCDAPDAPRLLPCAIAILVEAHAHAVMMGWHYLRNLQTGLPELASSYLAYARQHRAYAASIVSSLRVHGADAAADDLSSASQALDAALTRAAWPHPMTEAA